MAMFDKREGMPSLPFCHRFPHSETLIVHRRKNSILHSHLLCRFAARCTALKVFERTAANIVYDMRQHHYDDRLLSNRLQSFLPKSSI